MGYTLWLPFMVLSKAPKQLFSNPQTAGHVYMGVSQLLLDPGLPWAYFCKKHEFGLCMTCFMSDSQYRPFMLPTVHAIYHLLSTSLPERKTVYGQCVATLTTFSDYIYNRECSAFCQKDSHGPCVMQSALVSDDSSHSWLSNLKMWDQEPCLARHLLLGQSTQHLLTR